MKICGFCKTPRPDEDYHRSSKALDGLHTICKICRRKYTANASVAIRASVVERLGGRCSSPTCRWSNEDGSLGCADIRALQIDHIFGKGYHEYKRDTSTSVYYRALSEISTDELLKKYQILCACCNWIKRFTDKEVKRISDISKESS